jgi:hypothetical protein
MNADPARTTLSRVAAQAWGVALGSLLGLGLFVATLVLVVKGGPDVGQHLGRIGLVLPGYDVSIGGAFLGLVYGFVVGYAVGRLIAPRRGPVSSKAHARLGGRALGVTLGLVLALCLFIGTNVLVLRGGADVGQLLGHLHLYFPGYAVSPGGSVIGALYCLAVGWLAGQLIARVYNAMVERAEA